MAVGFATPQSYRPSRDAQILKTAELCVIFLFRIFHTTGTTYKVLRVSGPLEKKKDQTAITHPGRNIANLWTFFKQDGL
jgi:hypothetical protein